mgnify:CR=1 FL=1
MLENSVYYLNTDRNMSNSRIFSAGEISKDSNGFVVRKHRGDPGALREVILAQKEKLDKGEKDLIFLRDELKARESHIKVLQDENHQLLKERRSLNDRLTELSSNNRLAFLDHRDANSRSAARIYDLEE